MTKQVLIIVFILIAKSVYTQDTLSIMAYNILNYPISNSTKADTLKHIINYVKPDIFMVTELTSGNGADVILNTALNINGTSFYQKANFVNGPDTDNLIYYNSNKLTLYSQQEIPTVLRNISEYVLYLNSSVSSSDTIFIYCYVAHLKAQGGSANENQRNQEATTLKNFMDTRTNIENVFLGGDFNLYNSSEPAHNTILNTGSVPLFDPISTPGNWSNNSSFASVHTQSTRLGFIGDGGAFGGMDDRFDWIFITNDILNGDNGLIYVPNSYKALGNDGNHYNKSINSSPVNSAVPVDIANALYYFSDHLPIIMKVAVSVATVDIEKNFIGKSVKLYPNPTTGLITLELRKLKDVHISITDLSGNILYTNNQVTNPTLNISLKDFATGTYLLNVRSGSETKTIKVVKKQTL